MFKGKQRPHSRPVLNLRSWRRTSMKFFKWRSKMPSKHHYNLVTNDDYDTRIPLHPEAAFEYGITFDAKYIGSMDVPRPTSRVEIVAAMRRVRYEFKAKGVKKRKVIVSISMDGVKITIKKKKNKLKKKKSSKLLGSNGDESSCNGFEIMHHPIYRIFYVSHDSSDLNIFSYIARDAITNNFKCNVFKSNKKSQAMKIVRTVGQAFEVCHKLQNTCPDGVAASTSSAVVEPSPSDRASHHTFKEAASDYNASDVKVSSVVASVEPPPHLEDRFRVTLPKLELLPPPPRKEHQRVSQSLTTTPTINLPEFPECITKVDIIPPAVDEHPPQTADQHQVKLLREKLEQQAQQTRAAVAQLLLLRDQLAAEQAARCEAQTRTHQLLVHNKELLEHITGLVTHLQERERGSNNKPINAQQLTLLPQGQGNLSKKETITNGNQSATNTPQKDISHESLIDFITQGDTPSHVENNNLQVTQGTSPSTSNSPINGNHISFKGMTNEQIQNYLITKFETAQINEAKDNNYNKQYFQNSQSFPHIPPLSNHFSSMDLASLLNHTAYGNNMDIVINKPDRAEQAALERAQSQCSLSSSSAASSSKDSIPDIFSSEEAPPFIMPLSHKTILKTTCPDGRTKLIVPVSPSGSHSDVTELKNEATDQFGDFLRVPGAGVCEGGPITRASSERVPSNSEMMTALRSKWTRHTTK